MPLFGKSSKSPYELIKSLSEALIALEKAQEDVSKNVVLMKNMLYDTNDTESETDIAVTQLAQELYNSNLLLLLINNLSRIEFEAKKDVTQIFNNMLRRQIGTRLPTVEYMCTKPEILFTLIAGYEKHDIALNCGSMLRECARYEVLAKIMLQSEDYYKFFNYVEVSNFDIASDAFSTFKELLTRHKSLSADFLESNYDKFFTFYQNLLNSGNDVTKRQSLKLLGELLLDRHYFAVMTRYISSPDNLKLMMTMLKDKSRNIQFEAFHVFKVFVTNPNKPNRILDTLLRNKDKLVDFLTKFQTDRADDKQFNDEKAYLIKLIRELKPLEETPSTSSTEPGLDQAVVSSVKRELQTQLSDLIHESVKARELRDIVRESIVKYSLTEHEVSVLLWNTLMSTIEWNKKEELVAEEVLKQMSRYMSVFVEFTKSPEAELTLIVRIQENCYENKNFLKVFHKIVVCLHESRVISKDTILKWYTKDHSINGKDGFLEQMKDFVEYLKPGFLIRKKLVECMKEFIKLYTQLAKEIAYDTVLINKRQIFKVIRKMSEIEILPIVWHNNVPYHDLSVPITINGKSVDMPGLPFTIGLRSQPETIGMLVDLDQAQLTISGLPIGISAVSINENIVVNVNGARGTMVGSPIQWDDIALNLKGIALNIEPVTFNIQGNPADQVQAGSSSEVPRMAVPFNINDIDIEINGKPSNAKNIPVNLNGVLTNISGVPIIIMDQPVECDIRLILYHLIDMIIGQVDRQFDNIFDEILAKTSDQVEFDRKFSLFLNLHSISLKYVMPLANTKQTEYLMNIHNNWKSQLDKNSQEIFNNWGNVYYDCMLSTNDYTFIGLAILRNYFTWMDDVMKRCANDERASILEMNNKDVQDKLNAIRDEMINSWDLQDIRNVESWPITKIFEERLTFLRYRFSDWNLNASVGYEKPILTGRMWSLLSQWLITSTKMLLEVILLANIEDIEKLNSVQGEWITNYPASMAQQYQDTWKKALFEATRFKFPYYQDEILNIMIKKSQAPFARIKPRFNICCGIGFGTNSAMLDKLKPGDLIEELYLPMIHHWGVYVGTERKSGKDTHYVVHLQPISKSVFQRGYKMGVKVEYILKKEPLFTGITGRCRINNYMDPIHQLYFGPIDGVEVAEKALKEAQAKKRRVYSLFNENCEHWATEFRYGVRYSDQARDFRQKYKYVECPCDERVTTHQHFDAKYLAKFSKGRNRSRVTEEEDNV